MDIEVAPGRYVVAVSGGVDSVSLLHKLATLPGVELVVAHFDHGIRPDSVEDRKLVQLLAQKYDVPFVYQRVQLGGGASEAVARQARYGFLEQVLTASHAQAIITAHHQDDVLETAIINVLRGTGRKGLASLRNRPGRLRPLLDVSKPEITAYARQHHLRWREDSTNSDETYLRNYIRRRIMPEMSREQRAALLKIVTDTRILNQEIDRICGNLLHLQPAARQLDRSWFIQLPHSVAKEILTGWLRRHGITQFDAKMVERLTVTAKTGRAGTKVDILGGASLKLEKKHLALEVRER